jgi:hypothetical protein
MKLVWRLKEQPTAESLQKLVSSGILSKEEAKEVLFNQETEEDRDKKSLESEIKFLRDLVEKLSQGNNSRIVEVIREVERPYKVYPWVQYYNGWCDSVTTTGTYDNSGSITTTGGAMNLVGNITGSGQSAITNFSSIKTF